MILKPQSLSTLPSMMEATAPKSRLIASLEAISADSTSGVMYA